ncbi:hypothetical protein B0H14DRAFT_2376772, partial [Mycena olivaceomarginata]
AVIAGRIVNILLPDDSLPTNCSVVLVEQFNVSDANDVRLNMPLLLRAGRTLVVSAKASMDNLLPLYLAGSDAGHSFQIQCPFLQVAGPRQERQVSKLKCNAVAHSEDNRFILNMHALHNAHLIRETRPRHLTAPKPCFTNRRAKHNEFAATLREIGPAKRAETVAKTQATKQRKKQDKADKLAGAQERGNDIS